MLCQLLVGWLHPALTLCWDYFRPKHKDAKIFSKRSKPCHVCIHWIALTKYSQLSTHLPGFQHFSFFVLTKLATNNKRVKDVNIYIWCPHKYTSLSIDSWKSDAHGPEIYLLHTITFDLTVAIFDSPGAKMCDGLERADSSHIALDQRAICYDKLS